MTFTPRRSLRLTVLLSALLLTGSGVAAAQAVAPPQGGYVALGDSYSSGLGAGDYRGGGACRRSARSYAQLWAAAHPARRFDFTACSGATSRDVLTSQLGPLNEKTDLVSITAGANDAGFADVMTVCSLNGDDACRSRVAQARTYIEKTLPAALDTTYSAIRKKSPKAHVVVLGYPHLFAPHRTCARGMTEPKQATLNAAVDVINRVMSQRAAQHGFTFGDVTRRFAEHGVCSTSPWIHPLTLPVSESYHPTTDGQEHGYLPEFTGLAPRAGAHRGV
ncbi:SGNH/GDSL hydrolase family protein [Streptomyces sp. NPDC006530]|uniref:SGNH/GDSL hydrolase family protein n=1 Tax=Streptomyces sp. NPDC006530 TaxID=3364750 RepID=UPI0036CBC5A7